MRRVSHAIYRRGVLCFAHVTLLSMMEDCAVICRVRFALLTVDARSSQRPQSWQR